MELKYCEQCGGLWVRERGAGVVFCDNCQAMVESLPVRKRPGRVRLPDGRRAERRYSIVFEDESQEREVTGGVA